MKNYLILNRIHHFLRVVSRKCHSKPSTKIRNIGILAHIDAGKTTTTERMLFYSGKINSPGEVHNGNTVTDCLSQERERGITICSSAVSFQWNQYRINLLDTPGHIDFTMEVEQSLSAVDGAVVILDSSAGVEAQTVTVWGQADRHKLPRIVFANKMDRQDADFSGCVDDLVSKLDVTAVPLHWPVFGKHGLQAIIDLINMEQLIWDPASNGQSYRSIALSDTDKKLFADKHHEIIDVLSGIDDKLAELIIETGELSNIDTSLIQAALRRATIAGKIVPVFLGSAYKNTGIQPLIDGILRYLPSPNDRNRVFDCFGDEFVGKVFKVTHDKQRGPLSLVRVLRGKLKKGVKLVTAIGGSETVQRIYEPLADEYKEVSMVHAGDVGVCAGLKTTVTGDILVSSLSSLKSAQKNLKKALEKNPVDSNVDGTDVQQLLDTFSPSQTIPDAVYFCSIEPPSLSFQLPLENALKQLQREDPSLRVKYDETTAQTVLGGMGSLHLDIIKSRLNSEYKIDAEIGPLQIAYKETIEGVHRLPMTVEKEISGDKQRVQIEISLRQLPSGAEKFILDPSPEVQHILSLIWPKYLQRVKKGALSALERGPKIGGEVIETQIVLHSLVVGRGTADSFIMATAFQCVQKILVESGCKLLEPIMSLSIVAPAERISNILSDLGRRRATILDVKLRGKNNKVVEFLAPLAELDSYSNVLRTISSGTASMSMQPSGYAMMLANDEETAVRKSQGLE